MIIISLCETVSCKFENNKYRKYKMFKFSISVVDLTQEHLFSSLHLAKWWSTKCYNTERCAIDLTCIDTTVERASLNHPVKSNHLTSTVPKSSFSLFQRTPLHIAAGKGYTYTTECLVAKGADINMKDNDGVSTFHY